MKLILKLLNITFFASFIVIVLQQVVGQDFMTNPDFMKAMGGGDLTESRLTSIYSYIGSIPATGFGFVPIFILLVELLIKTNKKNKIIIYILIGILFGFLSKSRWILLNALLVFLVLYYNYKHEITKFYKYVILIPFYIITTLVLMDAYGLKTIGILQDRILESNDQGFKNKSASTRILAFVAFNKVYWDNPILGKGNIKYGMAGTGKQDKKLARILKGQSSQLHVGYLSLFYIYGLIGAIFFLVFLYLILKELYNNAETTGYYGPFVAFLGFAVANLTLVTFSIFEMGLILALIFDKYYLHMHKIKLKKAND